MLALSLTIMMAVSAGVLVHIALPVIAQAIGVSAAESIWIVNAYQIGTVVTLLAASAAGETWGYKRVYLIGLVIMIVTAIAASTSDGLGTVSFWRGLQGMGAAAIMAVNSALLRYIYPPEQLGRGLSYNAMVVAVTSGATPAAAGAIMAVADWQWLFLINVPVGIAALIISWRVLPSPAAVAGRKMDFSAALLNAMMFGSLFLSLLGYMNGQDTYATIAGLAVAVLSAVILYHRSRGQDAPLVPFDLLRIELLRRSYAASFFCFVAQTMAFIALPFALHHALSLDSFETGMVMTPWPVALAIGAFFAGRAVEKVSPIALGSIGLILVALSLAGLGFAITYSREAVMLAMFICGAGLGLFSTPNNRTMLMGAPMARSGAAAGTIATVRLAGQTSGALLVTGLFHIAAPDSPLPYFVATGVALFALAISSSRRGTMVSEAVNQ